MKKNYIVEVFCRNCDYGCSGWNNSKKIMYMKIPLGTKVGKMKCPKCQCKSIEKTPKT